ncbi:MAG TPA: hypothetical protein VMX14_09810 [Anaerolineae bacterium]|nr:hypothetical protein [Anaerolineae bacterium]
MRDRPITASAVISFSQELEGGSSRFYEELAQRFAECRETFLGFATDGNKSRVLITRTYQETISDALEAGFSFQGLRLEDHLVELTLPVDMSLAEALQMAIGLEEKAVAFYEEVAERSQSLLATIPGAFRRVARRRRRRKGALEAMRG